MTLTNLVKILLTALIICFSSSYTPSYSFKSDHSPEAIVCEIFDLIIEPGPCDPNGMFVVDLTFQYLDVSNSFNLEVNGEDYGEYFYTDLPITVDGLLGDGTTAYQFVVSDIVEPNCSALEQIAPIACASTPSNCVNFSFLEDGENYGNLSSGDILTTENDITVTVVGYNETVFDYIEAIENPFCGSFPAANGIHIFMFNGLNFNFSGLGNTSVSYDYQTCAAEGAFSIDGGDFIDAYYPNTPDTSFNLSSGHLVHILRNPNLDSEGQVTITGPIENLAIQGIELSIDNICYSTDPVVCNISNLTVIPQDCNQDGTYDILVDFNYTNPGNDLFDLYDAFGNFLATYALADLPVLHESLVPEGTEYDAIQVCINDNPNCCSSTEFIAPECILPCELSNMTIAPTDCDGNFFGVIIDFDYSNTSSTFSVTGNGNDYGDFNYVDLPIIIGGLEGDGISGYEFLITDNDFPNCTIFDQIGAIDCNPDCEIISVEAYYECLNNTNSGTSYLHLDLEAENATDLTFLIEVGSNDPIGPFSYQSFPIFVSVPTSGSNILVYAAEDENCSYTLDVTPPDCSCGASDYTYDFIACSTGGWELSLDFEYDNPDEDFEVRDNDGNLLGTFNTSQLPITLEAPVGNDNGIFSVRLHFCFLETDCCTFENFQGPYCTGECHIFNGSITNSDCDDNGLIDLTFDFDYENVSDSFYIIIYDQPQEEYGPFAYNNLPLTITDLQADGGFLIIDVVDNEPNPSSNCRWGIDHMVPNCFGPDECMINDVIVEAICNESGTHDILIDLDIENVTDNVFYVEVSGPGNDGEYTIDDFPIMIEDYDYFFDFITVSVTDIEDPGCVGYKNIPLPQCEFCVGFDNLEDGVDYGNLEQGDTLTVENDIVVTVAGYNGTEFFYIEANEDPFCGPFPAASGIHVFMFNGLAFDFSALDNSSSVSFDFHTCDPGGEFSINGNDFTPFFYFSSLDTTFTLNSGQEVQIVRNPNINWEGTVTITGTVESMIIQGVELAIDNICFQVAPPPCNITDLVVEAQDCNDAGEFYIDLDFNATNTSDSFYVTVNTINQGHFSYNDLPINIGPFEGNGEPLQVIVHDLEDEDCWLQQDIEAPICDPEICEIGELEVSNTPCNPNGIYEVSLNFDFANTSDSFEVFIFEQYYGTFAYLDLPVDLGEFNIAQIQTIQIEVFDLDSPNCDQEIFYIAECDPVDCQITDLVASTPECNPNGGYDLTINFNVQNPGNDFFDLYDGNGDLIGFYALADLPITLTNYEPVLGQVDVFNVCINDNPNCCASLTLDFPECNDDCEIWDLVVEAYDCDDDGNFLVDLDFNFANTSDSFYVIGNGNNYGTFAYTDLFITLGPFEGNGQNLEFAVFDLDNQSCAEDIGFVAPVCNTCNLNSTATTGPCDDNGFFVIEYTTTNDDPNGDQYQVFVDGELYGTYGYDQPTVGIGPLEGNGQIIILTSVDVDDPNCSSIFTVQAPECDPVDCQITDLVASTPECNPNGGYDLTINFNVQNPANDFFDLYDGNDDLIGFYALADLPITLTNYEPVLGQVDVFNVCINDNPNCCASLTLDFPECDPPACEIWDLIVEAYDCDDDGNFLVDLDFNFANTSDSFYVIGNGNNYGTFAYTDLFITLGPFEGNGQNLEFAVFDLDNQSCAEDIGFVAPVCNPCNLNSTATTGPCDDNGFFIIEYTTSNDDPNGDQYQVFVDGELYGTYGYDQPTVGIGPLEGNGQIIILTSVDLDDPNCSSIFTVQAPECDPPACEIWDLIVEAYDCDDDGNFLVDLDFNFANTSDSFYVIGNGNNYGTFAYTDLFITLGPFEGNGQNLEFAVFDLDNQSCAEDIGFVAPVCDPEICEISGFEVTSPECNLDGGYDLVINFEVENPGNDFFDLYDGNGDLIGFYALADLPITLTNYEPVLGQVDVFNVCINDNPNCCASLTLDFPECNDDCEIWDLIVEAYDCDDDGNFLVDLDFNYANTSDSFYVIGNGNNYGTFAYTDLFITLGPFEGNGQNLEFAVFDLDNQSCAEDIGFVAPVCDPEICEISGFEVTSPECNLDGGYDLVINFEVENPGNDFFDLYDGNGDLIGFYALADLPITLTNYEPVLGQVDVFNVCINDNPNCCASLTLDFPECNDDCEIWDLVVEAYDCDDDGNFLVDLDFNYANTSDSFYVIGNGNNYGTFAYTDLFITLGPFEGNGQNLEFAVFDLDNQSCAEDIGFVAPVCDPEICEISGFEVTGTECNLDGGYDLVINFEVENPGNDFFDLYDGNGDLIGFYALADLPITLTGYIPTQTDIEIFQACINDQPNCCFTYSVTFPVCSNDCEISNLSIEPFCDGNGLFAEINFDYNGNGSDSFQILSCAPIGNFEYNSSGVYIIEIPEDLVNCAGGDFIPIGIYDLDDDACNDTEFLFIPDCYETPCLINDITTVVSDCNDDNEFFVSIDFEYDNTGSIGFSVNGNGEDYGDFEYDDLPITLGPFSGEGQDLEFIITDNEDDDCWNFATVTAPECTAMASTCIEFEGLIDGLNYGGSNSQPGDLLMIENEVHVTMEGLPDPLGGNNYDYMFATTQDICNPFDAASGNRTFMFNGLRFDFSPLTENPTLVTFPYHNCGIPFAISVNDQQPVTYLAPTVDTTFNLSPTVSISIQLDATNPEEGVITLDGFVSSFFIGGIELQIDNVCFNVENLVPDVWPGDANFDNIANHFDLLNVGIAYGAQGESRSSTSTDWFAMPAEAWAGFYADEETNYKHADCDGNGEVNIEDPTAILENYNLTHGPVPIFVQVPGTPDDPPFFVDLPNAGDIIIGQPFEAPIILGSPALPVDEIYGIAFTVEFPADMMDEDQVTIEIGDSWMGEDGQSIIHLNKKFAVDGKFEVAITRTNQTNISGQGQIASFIGIIDDILGRSELGIKITHVSAINFDENPVPLYRTTELIDLAPTTVPNPEDGSLDIYPSPTIDLVNIENTTGEQIKEIKVYNVLGQLMYDLNNPSSFETISVSGWAAGIYIVKVELETETVTKRIKKALP